VRSEAPLAATLAGRGAVAVAGVAVAQRAAINIIFLEPIVVIGIAEVAGRVGDLPDQIFGSHLLAEVDRNIASVSKTLSD
jgi:hypothetical protein